MSGEQQAQSPDQEQNAQSRRAQKEIIASKIIGTVKWFNVKSGYGFINRDDTQVDVFIHRTAILRNNPKKAKKSVGEEEKVEFDIVRGDKGFEAVNVTGPNGEPVVGSKYAPDKKPRIRRNKPNRKPNVDDDQGPTDNNNNNDNSDVNSQPQNSQPNENGRGANKTVNVGEQNGGDAERQPRRRPRRYRKPANTPNPNESNAGSVNNDANNDAQAQAVDPQRPVTRNDNNNNNNGENRRPRRDPYVANDPNQPERPANRRRRPRPVGYRPNSNTNAPNNNNDNAAGGDPGQAPVTSDHAADQGRNNNNNNNNNNGGNYARNGRSNRDNVRVFVPSQRGQAKPRPPPPVENVENVQPENNQVQNQQ